MKSKASAVSADDNVAPVAGLPVVNGPLDLARLRVDYEANEVTMTNLAIMYGISRDKIYVHVEEGNWKRRRPRRVDRHDLVERLLRLLETQILKLEFTMDNPRTDESAVLNKLSATLDRLISLKSQTGRGSRSRSTRMINEMREKVSKRIARLAQS